MFRLIFARQRLISFGNTRDQTDPGSMRLLSDVNGGHTAFHFDFTKDRMRLFHHSAVNPNMFLFCYYSTAFLLLLHPFSLFH